MLHKRRLLSVAAALILGLAALVHFSGCSMGYTNLRPGENGSLYNHLFQDVINTYDEPHWLWVRGTIAGDMNGNGIVEEEMVIATIQKGTPKAPGPIELAFLVVCEVTPEGERRAIARTRLFDANPVAGAPRPTNNLDMATDAPFTRARAQMVQDKTTLKEMVVVYFWADPAPATVWYAGYALEEERLVKNLETVVYQNTPGFLAVNLDRSIDANRFGYQLAFGVHAIPDAIMRKLGSAHEAPIWGHVYARNENGQYEQADTRFGDHYRRIENSWNQLYLKASLQGLPPDELAWFEYHMGLMNYYTRNHDMALGFLRRAREGAKDETLIRAIDKALETARQPLPAEQ